VKAFPSRSDENPNETCIIRDRTNLVEHDEVLLAEEQHDIDDDQGDVDWVVETIDTDSDEESEDDDCDADLETEEKAMAGSLSSNTSDVDPPSRKRKWSSHDELENTQKPQYKSIKLDEKLKMMPVVVLHDIIRQLLNQDNVD
jgi:hypothetical protein